MPDRPPAPTPRDSRGRYRRLPLWRPKVRGDCEDLPGPCLFVACRYNLYLDVSRAGVLRQARPRTAPGGMPPGASCALAVAAEGSLSQAEVAELLGITVKRIEQIEASARATLKKDPSTWAKLRGLLEQMADAPAPAAVVGGPPARIRTGREQTDQELDPDAWADEVLALVREGVPLRAAWVVANRIVEGEPMPKPKKSKDVERTGSKPPEGPPHPTVRDAVFKRRYTERLPCKNNEAQDAVLAGQLADVLLEKWRVEEEKSEAAKAFRERIEALEAREKELAEQVRSHARLEDVVCAEYLLPTSEVQIIREDTGEVVKSRTATAEDLQESLPITPPAAAPEGAKPAMGFGEANALAASKRDLENDGEGWVEAPMRVAKLLESNGWADIGHAHDGKGFKVRATDVGLAALAEAIRERTAAKKKASGGAAAEEA